MNMAVQLRPQVDATIARVGDAMLWAWGESRKNGFLEALLNASVAAIDEDSTPRAPGTHSNPTLSRLIACEVEDIYQAKQNRVALTVETHMAQWRRDRHLKVWVVVAEHYYSGPHPRTNAQVASLVNVSERTVGGIRRQMRRMLFLACGVDKFCG